MSSVWSSRPKVYCLDDTAPAKRPRASGPTPSPSTRSAPLSTRSWLGICAAMSLACGISGWALGQGDERLADDGASVLAAAANARSLAPDVANLPFGEARESTTGAPRQAEQSAQAPPLPFVVVRTWMEHGQPTAMLDWQGQRVVARGLSVHADYLVQVDREQIVFTYLPSALRQGISLPPGSWHETRSSPRVSGLDRSALTHPAFPARVSQSAPVEFDTEDTEKDALID